MTTIIQLPAVPGDISTAAEFERFFWPLIFHIPAVSGVTRVNNIPTELIYENDLTPQQQAEVAEAIAAHLAIANGKIQNVLDLIGQRRAQIANDLTALTAATTLAAVKPIVQRMLNAEDTTLVVLDKTYKYFRWTTR